MFRESNSSVSRTFNLHTYGRSWFNSCLSTIGACLISPNQLQCEEHPLSIYILENRWRLFGHILRRNIEIPANKSMNSYFATHGKKFRGRPLTTLPVVLNKDLSRLQENTLQFTTREDLEHLRCIAQNRQQWRELSTRIRKAAEAPPSDD